MNRRALVFGASALGLALFGGGTWVLRDRRAQEEQAEVAREAATPGLDERLIRPHSPILGPAAAPVTLVEFFDPSCESCRAFHPTLERLLAEFPEKLRIVMRYAAFHEGSDEAVRILEVARRQNLFEPVLKALLTRQPEWADHGRPRLDLAWRFAAEAGLDLEKGRADRLFPGITAALNRDAADVQALAIRGTPTFFLNGRRLTNVSFQSLAAEVRQAASQS